MRLLRRCAPGNDELVMRIVYRVLRKIIKRNNIFKEFFCLFIFVLNSILDTQYRIPVLLSIILSIFTLYGMPYTVLLLRSCP